MEGLAENLTEQEVERARAMLKSTLLMGLESPYGRADAAAGQAFTFGRPIPAAEIRELLERVTVEDVRRCAARSLNDGKPAISIVGPADAAAVEKAVGAAH